MKIDQCAIQLFTLRDRMKTREDLEVTLRKVKEIGYSAVQLSRINWDIITEQELVNLCATIGLTICATMEPGKDIVEHPEKIALRLKALGCRYAAYAWPEGIDFSDEHQVKALIKGLDHAGKVLADAGLVLTYHNHHVEFRKNQGTTFLERFFAETDPTHLQGCLDTYWVQYGGANPVDWCRRLKGRLPIIHLKDFAITDKNEICFAEIGAGNLDFKTIVAAAEASGCAWFIVEQDVCPGDEFESIAKSLSYIRSTLINKS